MSSLRPGTAFAVSGGAVSAPPFRTSNQMRGRDLRGPLLVLASHVAVFAALLWWTWMRWPDPLIDFGRELYLPWQIGRGQVLYRDLESLFGPLSPYVNALWFRVFGTSLLTLALCNLAIFAAIVAGIHRLIRLSTDRMTAGAASLVTILLFGFSQFVGVGNYNFVTPYSHEATHGMALGIACFVLLHRTFTRPTPYASAGAGACLGLALLTKPEIAAATAAGAIAGWSAAYAAGRGGDRRHLSPSLALFVAASMVPPLLFLLYFATEMDLGMAARATAGAWVPLFGTPVAGNAFYRSGMGLDAPVANAGLMLATFTGIVAYLGAAAAVSWSRSDGSRPATTVRVGRMVLVVGAFVGLSGGAFPRAFPVIVVAATIAAIALFVRARHDGEQALRWMPLVMWSPFALVLLAKMGLNARLHNYGFYLAMPAMVLTIAVVVWLVPATLAACRSPAAARSFRSLALGLIAAAVAPYLGVAFWRNQTRTLAIGSGADRFYASTVEGIWQGRAVRDAMRMLELEAAPDATLAVLPEGVMLNYLLRLDSPLRVINLMPPELMAFGEDDVLRSLAAKPPDFVLLVDKDTTEYGFPPFGSDARYGLRTVTWINEHYRDVDVIRDDRSGRPEVRMRLLRRGKH